MLAIRIGVIGLALTSAAAIVTGSENAAEKNGLAVIEQISQAPQDDYTDFIESHLAPDFIERRGMASLQRIFSMLAGNHDQISVESMEFAGDSLRFLAQDSTGKWIDFEFQFGPGPEYLIAGLSVQLAPPPPDANSRGLTEKEWVQVFAEFVEELAAEDGFSGSVIIAKGSTPAYAQAFGEANKGRNVPNTLETPINLGSMNKMFTGVAIAQLVEQGKLSYDDVVGEHLPDYPNADVRDNVTVHQLLTHTSGLGSYWNDAYQANKSELAALSDFAELFEYDELLFEPGTEFHYSNNGPVVLGLILEAISGMDYYEYVRENIYQVAGMSNSDHYPVDDLEAGFATGYYKTSPDGSWQDNTSTMGRMGSAAGGGYASAIDLFRFSIALTTGELLGKEHVEVVTTGKVPMGPDTRYAYLFGDHNLNGQRYYGHNGGAPGISAEFSIFPDLGYTVIVLANYDEAAMQVGDKARQLIAYNAPK